MKKSYAIIAGIVLIVAIIFIAVQNQRPSEGMQTFKSESQLASFLEKYSDGSYSGASMMFAESSADNSKAGSGTLAPTAAPQSQGRYSTTNNQIATVDEPDFVKNNGDYIFIALNTNVSIISAQPATETALISTLDVNGTINEISLYQNMLVVMGSENYYAYPALYDEAQDRVASDKAQIVRPYYQPRSFVKIYDISDPESPQLVNTMVYDGTYYDARLINSYIYIIANQQLIRNNDGVVMPAVDGEKIAASSISYFPGYDSGYQLTTIFTFDLDNAEGDPSSASFLTGYTQTLFVSDNNIYLTAPKYVSYNDYNKRMIEEVLLPVLDLKSRAAAETIIAGDGEWYQKEEMISVIVSDYYNSLSESEKRDFEEELADRTITFEADWQKETQKTTIYKLSLDDMDVEYEARGEVPGHLLNQFSLDEHEGNLRVATTNDASFGWGGPVPFAAVARGTSAEDEELIVEGAETPDVKVPPATQVPEEIEPIEPIAPPVVEFQTSNNIYVLDDNLNIIGSLTNLAEGERIYSARFMGDRVCLVTFKQVDPLFVIDLSNPRVPKVLGELKIPGFSTYLHPYDEDTIIGIGQDADGEIDEGFMAAIPAGLKIALFDVSDPENPQELDRYILGDRGTYSEALYEHKAFFFDKETNTLVLPVNVQQRTNSPNTEDKFWYPTKTIFMGSYVFDLSNREIEVKGTITHLNASEVSQMSSGGDYYYSSYDANIQRTLLINDALYTISQREVRASDITSLDTLSRVALPNPYYQYYFYEGRAAAA